MNIVFVGNFEPANSTENDLRWTFEDMGHTVIPCQENKSMTDDILAKAEAADMFFYIHTHGWVTPGSIPMREVIKRLHRQGKPTVAFHLDYWYGLDRAVDVGQEAFWFCDYVFTADGDPRTQEWFKGMGINHYWSPPAVVKRDCYFAPDTPELRHEIIFVGSSIYHKEWPYRLELINWLKTNYGGRFAHYGNGGIKSIRGDELNRLYASSKVVVGDSLCLNFDHVNYWSDRVYETRGRGGFLIHPEIEGLDDHMVKYPFKDFGRLRHIIDYYLQHPAEREERRLEQQAYVKQNHTYHNRLQRILDIVGGKAV